MCRNSNSEKSFPNSLDEYLGECWGHDLRLEISWQELFIGLFCSSTWVSLCPISAKEGRKKEEEGRGTKYKKKMDLDT